MRNKGKKVKHSGEITPIQKISSKKRSQGREESPSGATEGETTLFDQSSVRESQGDEDEEGKSDDSTPRGTSKRSTVGDESHFMSDDELHLDDEEVVGDGQRDSREGNTETGRRKRKVSYGGGRDIEHLKAPIFSTEQKEQIFTAAVEFFVSRRLSFDQFDSVFAEAICFANEYARAIHLGIQDDPRWWPYEFKEELRNCCMEHLQSVKDLVDKHDLLHPHQFCVTALPNHNWAFANPWYHTGSMSSQQAAMQQQALTAQLQQFNKVDTSGGRKGTGVPRAPTGKEERRVLQTHEIFILEDIKVPSISKFLNFVKTQLKITGPAFDYSRYLGSDLLRKDENILISTAESALGIPTEDTQGWGERGFNVVAFLEEYLRRSAAQGVTINSVLVKERFKDQMFPVLLQYHPGLVAVWPRVFIEYDKIKKSYGDYSFEHEVSPVLNLWVNVREFWRELQKHPKCAVALHTLVMNLMGEWEQKKRDDSSAEYPTLHSSFELAAKKAKDIREKAEELDAYGYSYGHRFQNPRTSGASDTSGGTLKKVKPNPNTKGEPKGGTDQPKVTHDPPADTTPQERCRKCGGSHETTACLNANPDANDDLTVTFAESAKGKAWAAIGHRSVPFGAHLTLDYCTKNPKPPKKGSAPSGSPAGGGGKGNKPPYPHKQRKDKSKSRDITDEFLSALDDINKEHASIIPLVVSVSPYKQVEFRCLIDTGSLQSNFASGSVKREIGATAMDQRDNGCKVCSPISEVCVACSDQTTLQCSIFDDLTKSNFDFKSKFKFLDSWHIKKYDMIIGLVDILKHGIMAKMASRFQLPITVLGNESDSYTRSNFPCESSRSHPNQESKKVAAQLETLTALTHSEVEPFGYTEPTWDLSETQERAIEVPLPRLHGDPDLQRRLLALVQEFSDIWAEHLDDQPADVTPMVIEVDREKWESIKNRQPYRLHSASKEAEIKKQVDVMLKHNIIRPSTAPYWSQVHLVPKPGLDRWRFTIDFRNLNLCIKKMTWPIPNIAHLLQRIGRARPKYFAKFDMPIGYNQFLIAEESRHLTSFKCWLGQFEWNRIVMGISNSGSEFQMRMAMEILAGVIYHGCEVYLDDICVFGATVDEFITNLRKVFERFRAKRSKLHPFKSDLGKSSVVMCGHTIDETGIHFARDKIDSVENFPRPEFKKQLKSFLGLANYFGNHVRNASTLARPLHGILEGYTAKARSHRIRWVDDLIADFERLKSAICNCQKLYFLDDSNPIVLRTDASDYGIGAYLLQLINDISDGVKEHPIMFISKSLDKTQCRWSTPEKEMYAIWYSLKKMHYLIGDRQFTIETDHENLIRESWNGSDKVTRWKLDIQSYNFDIKHIAGVTNEVADSFSRLCEQTDVDYCASLDEDEDIERYLGPQYEDEMESEELACLELASLEEDTTIPREAYRQIGQVHNSLVGHHGVERTLLKLIRHNKKWPYMREHIRCFIKKCPLCQKISAIKVPINTLPFTNAAYKPMFLIGMDTIGPLTKESNNLEYILVLIDQFTRYVELFPIADTSAQAVVQPLVEHVGRYGIPYFIQSDRGTQFVNDVIKELTLIVGTQHQTTLAYSKEENAIVERANKEVMRHLRAFIFDIGTHEGWSQKLPLVSRIMNSSVHSATGVSPASLLYGNSIDLDRGLFVPLEALTQEETKLSDWAADMLRTQERLMQIAEQRQLARDDVHVTKHAVEEVSSYQPNTFVLVSYPDGAMGPRPPSKLHTNLRGPLRVISNTGPHYKLYNMVENKEETHHIKTLHPYLYDPQNGLQPSDVALKDTGEFRVESIVKHVGDPKRKSEMDFLVRWMGYDDSHNLWLPWASLRNNPKLHEYLTGQDLQRLIPKEHRPPKH